MNWALLVRHLMSQTTKTAQTSIISQKINTRRRGPIYVSMSGRAEGEGQTQPTASSDPR